MKFFLAPWCLVDHYTYEECKYVESVAELWMWVAIGMIVYMLISYARTKQQWKKAYTLLRRSMFLLPVVNAVIFITFRSYIAILIMVVMFCVGNRLETKEIQDIRDKLKPPTQYELKKVKKSILILMTLAMIGVTLLVLYCNGITYTI
jgi:hypothetical protein